MAHIFEFIGASKGGLLMDTGALTTNDIGKLMAVSHQGPLANTGLSGRTILILIGVAVILHVGQEIFVPLALALLLTFTLAPIVSFLRKHSVPKIAAVILAVASAFMAIALFSFVVATQVTNLAENIPTYQRNIVTKVQALSRRIRQWCARTSEQGCRACRRRVADTRRRKSGRAVDRTNHARADAR